MEEEQVAVLWISWLAAAASGAIMEMVSGVQEVEVNYAKEKLMIQKLYRRWLLHLITDKEQLHSEAMGFIWRRNSQKNLRKFRLLLLGMVLASISHTQSER